MSCPRRPECQPLGPARDADLIAQAVARIRAHAAGLDPESGQYLLDTADEMALTDPGTDGLSIELLAALLGRTREVTR